MDQNLKFVDANPEDAELLSQTSINSKKIWGYSEELIELWKPDLKVSAEYISKNKVVKVFDKEMFVGFFAIKTENGNTQLDHLWLTPENIKQNYGRKIFEYIVKYLSSNGFQKMTLIAEPNAKGFYDKMGGKIIGKFQSKISGRFLDIYEYQIQ